MTSQIQRNKGAAGAIVIIVLIIIIGAYYVLRNRGAVHDGNQTPNEVFGTTDESEARNEESAVTAASSLSEQGTSDEISDIERDLEDTNFEHLEEDPPESYTSDI